MKLKPKFIMSYLAISLIVFIVGIINYLQLKEIDSSLEDATGHFAPLAIEVGRIQYIGTRMREEATSSALLQTAAISLNKNVDQEEIDEENEEFEESFELLENLLTQLKEREDELISEELNQALNTSASDIFTIGEILINIGSSEENLSNVDEIKESLEETEERFLEATNELLSICQSKFESSRQIGSDTLNESIVYGWIGITAAILLSVVLGNMGSKGIVNPVLELISATKEIPKGNYQVKEIELHHDEINSLYEAFIAMVKEIKKKTEELVGEIKIRKESEELTKSLNKQLRNKNDELQQIIYGISHDLRSPLINITGFSDELKDLSDTLKEELKAKPDEIDKKNIDKILHEDFGSSIEFIQMGTKKIDELLNGLLKLARLGYFKPTIEKQDMNNLLNSVLSSFSYLSKENKIDIVVEKLPDCLADKNTISQLFSNLVGNAIKYSDSERESFIKISGHHENDNSVYIIEDNGIGMGEKDLSKIFDIFYRARKSKKDGYGLGLAIVKRIIELHKGEIRVESEIGKGSKFYISIPCENFS